MNDLLDRRIREFVAELVQDPPELPPLSRPRVVERQGRRLSGPEVAIVAFAVVLISGSVTVLLRPFAPSDHVVPSASGTRVASTETFLGIPVEPSVPFRADVLYRQTEAPDLASVSVETSYLGPGTLRAELVLMSDPTGLLAERTGIGSFVVANDASAASYLAAKRLFLSFPDDEAATVGLGELAWGTWADRCRRVDYEVVEEATILDQSVLHVRCPMLGGNTEVWVDKETGVVLQAAIDPGTKVAGDLPTADELGIYATTFRMEDLQYYVGFDASLFEVSAPDGSREDVARAQVRRIVAANTDMGVDDVEAELARMTVHPPAGSAAPALAGALLDGSTFDPDTVKSGRVALLWWASWCAPSLGQLAEFDSYADQRSDIAFVGVLVDDEPQSAGSVVEQGGILIPIVNPTSDSLTGWRVTGCPTTFLVEDGTVVAEVAGSWPGSGLETLLADAGW